MSKAVLKEVQRVRQMAAQNAGRWEAVEGEIRDAEGVFLARMTDRGLARYMAALHNLFIPLANLVLTLRKKLADRRAMTREIADDDDD